MLSSTCRKQHINCDFLDPTHHKMNKLLFGPLLFSIGALLLACNPATPTPSATPTPTPSVTPTPTATPIPTPSATPTPTATPIPTPSVTPTPTATPTPTPTPTPSATPPHSATSIPEPTPTTAAVQRALAQRGYYKGRIDDKLGPETRRAIREFQRKEGLRASGRVDSATIKKLAP